jgi:hypothetical protein
MASDGAPITLSVTQPANTGSASSGNTAKPANGKLLPNTGAPAKAASVLAKSAVKLAASDTASGSATSPTTSVSATSTTPPSSSVTDAAGPKTPAASQPDTRALVAQLNKHLNDSGLPDQYRVDPHSTGMIQEVNPANGAVIGEFSASEFPSLARSAGALGLLVDSLA